MIEKFEKIHTLPQPQKKLCAKSIFLTKGVGQHKIKLISFELALRNARIEAQNLVPVSSIYPPHCPLIDIDEGIPQLQPAEITFCVLAKNSTLGQTQPQLVGASIGIAVPKHKNRFGYIFEHCAINEDDQTLQHNAILGANALLATSLNPNLALENQNMENFQHLENVENFSISASAYTKKNLWTTTIAAAIFLT